MPDTNQNSRAGLWTVIAGAFALCAAIVAWFSTGGPSTPSNGKKTEPEDPKKPAFKKKDPDKRRIIAAYLTRRGPTTYRHVTQFDKISVPFSNVPGQAGVAEALLLRGQKVPPIAFRVDQETESLAENLGLKTHSLVSYKAFLNPLDGKVIAYDIAISSGGVPQRLVGHLNKKGVVVDIYRGGKKADQSEIAFPEKTSILPVELGFIHDWFQLPENKDYMKPVQWMFFVPEAMTFIRLIVYPPEKESLAHRGSFHECARYDVLVTSTKAVEGVYSRQRVWFNMRTSALMKRVDFEEGVDASEYVVTERVKAEELEELQPLVIRAPELPKKKFPYPLDRDLVYTVRARDREIGRIRVRFAKREATRELPGGYTSTAMVDFETGQQSFRKERAVTWFDEQFLPLKYIATGQEAAETRADYDLVARFQDQKVLLDLSRKIHPPEEGASPMNPQSVTPEPNGMATPRHPREREDWAPPLRLVHLEEQEEDEPTPKERWQKEKLERPLSPGTCVYDFNRVEHVALAAFRFELPAITGQVGATRVAGYQKVAFYSVRQNKASVQLFSIYPEPKPALPKDDPDEILKEIEGMPQLFVASATGSLMPCSMLLAPDGRLLQLTSKYGASEVIYTLRDPIMLRRAQRDRKLRGQRGPRLIRPPWY